MPSRTGRFEPPRRRDAAPGSPRGGVDGYGAGADAGFRGVEEIARTGGEIRVRVAGDRVLLGGKAVTVMKAELMTP